MLPADRLAIAVVALTLLAIGGCRIESEEPPQIAARPETTAPGTATAKAPTIEELEASVPENPLKEAYFGETHVHTSFSLDAYIGGARLKPDDAYRFAKGQDVTLNGQPHNIRKPLDFFAVSDHAEFIGEMYSTQVPGALGGDNPMLQELRGLQKVE